jgi:multiple sugar transport system substrate-binding protein
VRACLVAVGLATHLAGCGGGTATEAKQRVVFWQFWPMDVIAPIIERFEAENPDLDVVVEQLTWQAGQEKITAAVASGKVPDLVELGSTWFPSFAHEGALADWTDSAAALRDGYRLWEMCEVEGRIHGLPWLAGTRALFYNKQLFAAAGLDTSKAPATWDELYEACARINRLEGGFAGYGVNAGERYILFKKYMPYAWSAGAELLSPDGGEVAFDSPASVAALRFYLRLAEVGRIDQQRQLDQAFEEGRIGCLLTGGWVLKQVAASGSGLRFGVGLVPKPEDGEHRSFAGGELLASFGKSGNPSGAWRLARFLLEPENALQISRETKSVQPTAIAAEDDPYFAEHPEEKVLLQQLALSRATPNHPAWGRMESSIESAVEEALYGRITPEQAVAKAAREMERHVQSGVAARP